MYDEDRPRYRYRSRSRDREHERGGGGGGHHNANYRRSSRSPPHRRDREDDDDHDYYRSRKEDDDGGHHHHHNNSHRASPGGYHHGYSSRSRHNESSLPYDDDAANDNNPDWRARSRSRSPRRQHHHRSGGGPPGRPSATIIVEGLPNDATEDDILDGFASASPDAKVFSPENVKVVRLRNNKRGRRIGFVEFFGVNDAAHFLEYHYPGLEFQLAHSRGVDSEPVGVGINYSRGRDDEGGLREDRGRDERARGDDKDWTCSECAYANYGSRTRCHRCRAAKPDGHYRGREASYGPMLTGETDEDPQQFPSQYLVIRGLDPTITEEGLADGVKQLYVEAKPEPKKDTQNKLKSTAPTANTANLGAKQDSLRRVFLVRDRRSDEAMRYGFAEFATLEDAQAAISKFKASPKFNISGKPVTVAFIHTGVFVPHKGPVTEDNSRYIFNPVYNRDIFLKYWDSRVYPSILQVSEDVGATKDHSVGNADGTGKAGKAGVDEIATVQDASGKKIKRFKLGQAAAKPAPVMGSQLQMWAKKRAELVGDQGERDDGAELSPAPSEHAPKSSRPRKRDSYISYSDPDSLSCLLCMRKFESALALRDHEVLNQDHKMNVADEAKRKAANERLKSLGRIPKIVALRVATVSRAPSDKVYMSYADRDKLHCLVCQRKFTKAGMLSLHERESEMHRVNLGDPSNIERAISQLARVGKTPCKMVPAKNKGQQYRDRARERRQVYNQPNAPRRKPVTDAPPAKEPEKPAAPSKGAALLGKMGWTAGEGLGADRTGRTDVIATDVYAAGVGLGAEGGKLGDAATEAARKTKDNYTDFVEVTRNKARERYEKMGG